MSKLIGLIALLSVTALAGCGGGGGNANVDSILKDTFGSNSSVKSGRLNLAVDADVKGVKNLNGPVSIKLTGPFQSSGKGKLPKFDFTLSLGSTGSTITAGAVSTGDKGFLKFQNQAYSVPDQLFSQFQKGYSQAQAKSGSKDKGTSFATLGIDPRAWLKDPKKVADADVGGTSTYHVTAGIDVPKLLDDLDKLLGKAGSLGANAGKNVPGRLTPQQRQKIQDAVTSATVDVYSGKDDKLLRKLAVNAILKTGKVAFVLELDDLNGDQSISVPANAKPLQELLQQIPGLLGGGASGGTGGTSQGSTPVAPATSPGGANPKYVQCLQSAGQDISKLQACAKLL